MVSWDTTERCLRYQCPTWPGQAQVPWAVESWDPARSREHPSLLPATATAKQGIEEEEDGPFCPLFILSLTSPKPSLALPWTQHCPSPAEPCPGPTQTPTAATSPRLLQKIPGVPALAGLCRLPWLSVQYLPAPSLLLGLCQSTFPN